MTPTEHEGTVAVDAAARKFWELQERAIHEQTNGAVTGPSWEQLNHLKRNEVRQHVLPLVWAALEALPDRRADAWDEGWRAAAEVVDLEGEETWAHAVFPEGYEGNPYRGAGE